MLCRFVVAAELSKRVVSFRNAVFSAKQYLSMENTAYFSDLSANIDQAEEYYIFLPAQQFYYLVIMIKI